MPDSITRDRGNALLDHWYFDGRPRLQAIRGAALDLLNAIEEEFQVTYDPNATRDLSASATDIAGTVCDLLSDAHGRWLSDGDERRIDASLLSFDTSELDAEHSKWKARAESRASA